MQKIILIGGSPCAGKSSLAKSLAKHFSIPYISTDIIRSFMQELVTKKEYPFLFDSVDITPEEYFEKFTPEQIVQNQINESSDVWEGVKRFIETNYDWQSYVIEGVALMPKELHEYQPEGKQIIPLFLTDTDVDRLKDVIFNRGLWNDADKYSDEIKKIEHIWLIKFNEWLQRETDTYQMPLLPVTTREEVFEKALALINEKFEK